MMHPGSMHWWKSRQRAAERGTFAECGPGSCYTEHPASTWSRRWAAPPDPSDLGAGAFGVRRPLRFLAYKLRLDDAQVAQLARILGEVKTERAQAEVDSRRTLSAFADAVAGSTFDEQRAGEGAALRVKSAERLREVVVKALAHIHALLEPEQRERLAYLIRTGTLMI
jgi:Spy/CpxP family protein refolding chaperone